jgi:Ca2+-binding EF-hand superfamily protein
MKIHHSILAISLLVATGSAIAVEPVKIAKPTAAQTMDHSKMDMSHGQMDHSQMTDDAFAKLDANKDGKLSKGEMAKDPKAAHFSMLDTDKNGSLSRAEFAKASGM